MHNTFIALKLYNLNSSENATFFLKMNSGLADQTQWINGHFDFQNKNCLISQPVRLNMNARDSEKLIPYKWFKKIVFLLIKKPKHDFNVGNEILSSFVRNIWIYWYHCREFNVSSKINSLLAKFKKEIESQFIRDHGTDLGLRTFQKPPLNIDLVQIPKRKRIADYSVVRIEIKKKFIKIKYG